MSRITMLWLVGLLLAALVAGNCGGIISEQTREDGQTERIRLDAGPRWHNWDRNATKGDDASVMLKKELTF